MDDAIGVGIIGAGNIGTAHAENLGLAVAGSRLAAVFDVDPDRAAAVAGPLGARACSGDDGIEDLLADDGVDAVLIASPDPFHAEQVHLTFAADKPMLCEKPLAVTADDARSIVDAEVARGERTIQVGFMRRFDPGYRALKAELGADGIGEPLLVHHLHTNTRAPYGLFTEQTLTNMAIHELDIGRWLLDDEYESVLVLHGRPGPRTPEGEHDPILVVLRSASGVLVQIEAFVNATFGYQVACRVAGSEGQATMGDGTFVTRSRSFSRGVDVPELWLGRFAESYRLQLQGWIDAIRSGTPPPGASAWDGYLATVVANRAIEAYHRGEEVAIEVPPRPALYDPVD
ncbi:MAG: Gfo/Idh/MocA family oxidoreductase [Actinomycetota bacterium]